MRYFAINTSSDPKVIGHYPQVQRVKQNCDVFNEPTFIEHIHFTRVEFTPITANAVLFNSSKLTDLINVTGMGFTRRLLLSSKLKEILERYCKSGIQFFESDVIYHSKMVQGYWVLHANEVTMDFIDFKNSVIYETKNYFDKSVLLHINNLDEFGLVKAKINDKGRDCGVLVEKIRIADHVTADFFVLSDVEGGVKYVASERLKSAIEIANCTGVEFQPIDLSLTEWLHDGERERVYGKS